MDIDELEAALGGLGHWCPTQELRWNSPDLGQCLRTHMIVLGVFEMTAALL